MATMQITSTNFIEENIRDTIILQKVAIVIKVTHVKNHMKCSSRDTEFNRFFLSFWAIFCPFMSSPP